MDEKELMQIGFRYVRIGLNSGSERYINTNFDALLEYIGKYYPKPHKTNIKSACIEIRKETDRLLHVSWSHNWRLKTSKREVNSIRSSKYRIYGVGAAGYYLMLPYKVAFIFKAIHNILLRINEMKEGHDEAQTSSGKSYGSEFYCMYIEKYDQMFWMEFAHEGLEPAMLYNEFHAPQSIFLKEVPNVE